MQISLIAFGKLKTAGMRESADYYLKLLKSWAPSITLEEIELKPIPVPDKSPSTRLRIQQKEITLFLERTDSRPFWLLDERGKAMSTLQWAQWMRDREADGTTQKFCLGIGSSLGFSQELVKNSRCRGLFSFGPHTLPHELARIVLFEQLYRSIGVTRGHPYHNE